MRYPLCWRNGKAGAWKMHANLADLTITASDHDLMGVRGDQFTDNRVASGIVRRDGHGLARFPTDGIPRIDGRPGNRCGIPCYIKRLFRADLASGAMADGRDALNRYYNYPSPDWLRAHYAHAGNWSSLSIETGEVTGFDGKPAVMLFVTARKGV